MTRGRCRGATAAMRADVDAMLAHGQSADTLTEAETRGMGGADLVLNLFLRGAWTMGATEELRKRLNSLLVTGAPHYHSCDICCCVCIDPAPPVMRDVDYRCVQNMCLGCGLRVCADCSQGCTHCEATCAHVRCEGCGHLFCDTCSTVDFDHGPFERRFCLDCYTRNSAEPAK